MTDYVNDMWIFPAAIKFADLIPPEKSSPLYYHFSVEGLLPDSVYISYGGVETAKASLTSPTVAGIVRNPDQDKIFLKFVPLNSAVVEKLRAVRTSKMFLEVIYTDDTTRTFQLNHGDITDVPLANATHVRLFPRGFNPQRNQWTKIDRMTGLTADNYMKALFLSQKCYQFKLEAIAFNGTTVKPGYVGSNGIIYRDVMYFAAEMARRAAEGSNTTSEPTTP